MKIKAQFLKKMSGALAVATALSLPLMSFYTAAVDNCEESIVNGVKCYVKVQTQAYYRGGEKELQKFVKKASREFFLDYKSTKVSTVEFIVDASGDIKVTSVVDPVNSKAERKRIKDLVESMPNWVPGKCDGFNVPSVNTIDIHY